MLQYYYFNFDQRNAALLSIREILYRPKTFKTVFSFYILPFLDYVYSLYLHHPYVISVN